MLHVMCHMSHVTCHMSHVTCQMSCVPCHIFFFFFDKVVKLMGGGSFINGADPVKFLTLHPQKLPHTIYGRSRQCGRPVGAGCSMGLGRNLLINGLIQHTFKIFFLYVEKFTVIPFYWTKLFPVDKKSPWCFRKKIFWKQKIESQIFNWGPPRQAHQAKKTSSSWKIIEVTHLWKSGRSRGRGVIIIFLKLFFLQISWSCPQTYLSAGRCRKSPLDGATHFLATIWQHIITVSFL